MSTIPEVLPPAGSPQPGAEVGIQPVAGIETGELALWEIQPGDPLYEAAQRVAESIKASKSTATRRAYAADWRHFVGWCKNMGRAFLPATPQTVALYIAYLSKPLGEKELVLEEGQKPKVGQKPWSVATITRRFSSINTAHKVAGFKPPAKMDDPHLADTFHGICRKLGKKQNAKKPLTLDLIVKVIDSLESPVAAARDKALLLVGFVGALRRSELAAMRVEDLHQHRKGYTITLPRSKTDQEGEGREIDILMGAHDLSCPVLALENWLSVGDIRDGFVFRSVGAYGNVGASLTSNSIGQNVKRLVRRAKIDNPEEYGGHSLRAGFVTEASANGASDRRSCGKPVTSPGK
jgi:integrase